MKAMELAVAQEDCCCNIPITLIVALRWALECNGLFTTVMLADVPSSALSREWMHGHK